MKALIKLVFVAAVMFAASAGGAWYMESRKQAAATAPATNGETEPPPLTADPLDPAQGAKGAASPGLDLPVAVRARFMSPEEILRNAMSLRTREEALHKQEHAVEQQHARLQLVQADIQGEQTEMQGLAAKVRTQITAAEQLLATVLQQHDELRARERKARQQLEEFRSAQSDMSALEQQNVKRMSTWIQGMEPDTAANFIRELANDGKMDVAVQMLANFDERQASQILEAMNDSALMVQLAEKFRTLQRPERAGARR